MKRLWIIVGVLLLALTVIFIGKEAKKKKTASSK